MEVELLLQWETLGAVGLFPRITVKLLPVIRHEDFQVLTEKHHGAVSSKLENISSLPIWHCFNLEIAISLEGESGLGMGMVTAAFLIKLLLYFVALHVLCIGV